MSKRIRFAKLGHMQTIAYHLIYTLWFTSKNYLKRVAVGFACGLSCCSRYLLNACLGLLVAFTPYTAFSCNNNEQCIEQGQWSIGLAAGVGAKTNPLVDGNAIPQVLLLDIAWYGEQVYLDNTELGFRWLQAQSYGIETYVTVDSERAFFYFFDPVNLLASVSPPPSNSDGEVGGSSGQTVEVSIDDVQSRKWAILAGSRFNYYHNTQKWSLTLETDITGVHNGQRVALSYQKAWVGEHWRAVITPSITYKSDALIDYYYGLDAADATGLLYEGKGGFQPSISLFYAYDVSPKWQFIFSSAYQSLHSGMTLSPLVKDKHVSSFFIGAGYRF